MLWKIYSVLIRAGKLFSRKGVYPFLRRQLEGVPGGSRVLAVGSSGPTADLVREHGARQGFQATFLDIDPDKEPDIVADLCVHELGPEGTYTHVILSEVLEHLHAPQQAIDRIHGVLAPGGALVVTVPFIFPLHERPNDYYRFTRFGLAHLLRDFGEVDIDERNGWAEAIGVLIVRLTMESRRSAQLLAPLALLFVVATAPVALLLSRLVPTDYITTGYVVVARK